MKKPVHLPVTKIIFVVIGLLLLCCGAGVLGAGIYFYHYKSPADQATPIDASVSVYLSAPQASLGWPANSFIPIRYEVNASRNIDTIDLYVNGEVYDSIHLMPETKTNDYTDKWDWQPGVKGDYILTVQARDAEGMNGISQPMYIHATDETSMVSPLAAKEGETLQQIADQQKKPVEELVKVNRDVTPQQPLPGSKIIYVPLDPAPVVNPHVIDGYEPVKPEIPDPQNPGQFLPKHPLDLQDLIDAGVVPPQDEQGDKHPPADMPGQDDKEKKEAGNDGATISIDFGIPFLDKIAINASKYLVDKQSSSSDSSSSGSSAMPKLPAPVPVIKLEVINDCDVKVELSNQYNYNWHDYSGFKLYRSRDGGPFEKIEDIPPYEDSIWNPWLYRGGYIDKRQFGLVTYTWSAITPKGELMSAAVSKPLPGCQDPNPDPLQPGIDPLGDLKLPAGMDLAYFYIQITDENGENSQGWRVPEGDRFFLPNSGQKLNINYYLDSILAEVQIPEMTLQMEFWGWVGGKLVHAGNYKYSVFRNVLLVCSVAGADGCVNGGPGTWVRQMQLPKEQFILDQQINIKFVTTKKSALHMFWLEFQEHPSRDRNWNFTNSLFRREFRSVFDNANEHVVLLDMDYIISPNSSDVKSDKNVMFWGYPDEVPSRATDYHLYVRALPRYVDSGLPVPTSNDIAIHYDSNVDIEKVPPLASTFKSIYDVEILRDTYEPPNFEVPELWGCVVVDNDPTGKYPVGTVVCPAPIVDKNCGSFDSLESLGCGFTEFGEYVASGWDTLVEWYEAAKNAMANGLAKIIPGCSTSDGCKRALRYGIDAAIQYTTGLPPSLPSSKEVFTLSVSEGIYQAGVYGVGYVTGMDSEEIKKYCEEYLDCRERLKEWASKVYDEEISKANQPACINPQEAASRRLQNVCLDPRITVHSTRGGMNAPGVVGVKITRKDTPESQAATDDDLQWYRVRLTTQLTKTLDTFTYDKPGFRDVTIDQLPILKPGESKVVFLSLMNNAVSKNYRDYYFGGTSHMKLSEICASSGSTVDWVPCTDTVEDVWEFTNPASALEGMP